MSGFRGKPLISGRDFSEGSFSGVGVQTINAQNQWHGYVGMSADEEGSTIEFHSGVVVDLTGATFATAGGGAQTQITGVAHNSELGDVIFFNGCSTGGYNAAAQIVAVGGANDFTIDIAFIDDPVTEGFFQHPDHFKILSGAVKTIGFIASCSATMAVGAGTCKFAVYDNKTLKHQVERRFPNSTDVGAWANSGIIDVSVGDEISYAIMNTSNSNNIDISDISFMIFPI
jgi:hypothetical protein